MEKGLYSINDLKNIITSKMLRIGSSYFYYDSMFEGKFVIQEILGDMMIVKTLQIYDKKTKKIIDYGKGKSCYIPSKDYDKIIKTSFYL